MSPGAASTSPGGAAPVLAAAAEDGARRSRRRILVRGLLALVFFGLALEGSLRWLLFGNPGVLAPIAARFRNELRYTSSMEDDCWKLRALWEGKALSGPHLFRDEHLGWTNEDIEPGTLRHRGEPAEDGRELVLLYGNSFARGTRESDESWGKMLERSELGATHVLLNFGVGGYGLDQIHLLLAATIDRYVERNPLVILAILVDDSLDRSALALRNFPKPRFELVASELVLHPARTRSAAEFLASEPLGIRSYLWRFALHGSGLVPDALVQRVRGPDLEAHQALCRRLLVETKRLLEERGLRHFVLLFHADGGLAARGPYGWQEPFLYSTLRELELPFVSSKRALREDMALNGTPARAYFSPSRHYTTRAHVATFPALARGIRRQFEPRDGYLPDRPAPPADPAQ